MSEVAGAAGSVRLDFPGRDGERETLCFSEPVEVLVARGVGEVRGALRAAEEAAGRGHYVVGYVSYEAAPAFGAGYEVRPGARLPLVWFGVFAGVPGGVGGVGGVGGLREAGSTGRMGCHGAVAPPVSAVAEPGAAESGGDAGGCLATSSAEISGWEPATLRGEYDAAIAALQDSMARGELDQANYTVRLRARFAGDSRELYRDLLAAQGRAYGAYLDLGFARIVSVSPELFFRREGDRIELRPMKGTARRGRWPGEDDAIAARLAASPKDRGENLMTVEWMRRELEGLACPGSVELSRVCEVERYPTVFQLTSTLEAAPRRGMTLEGIFAGLFPSVSVTGVPRVAAMRRIAELEPAPREVYCGAIGVIRPGGDCVFNVAIRTVWLDTATGVAEYGVGGGITAASTAVGEYDEVLAKSAVLTQSIPEFELLETLRLAEGGYPRLERHLARLGASAGYFGWPDPTGAARGALAVHAREWPRGVRRVRVLADAGGGVRVESEGFGGEGVRGVAVGDVSRAEVAAVSESAVPAGYPVRLAREPVSRQDPFLYHKTTHRVVHEARRAESPECFDVLLWNEDGELTEFTRGNLVLELDGERWTPPRECGLLAGTFRGELLDVGVIRERALRAEDLGRATGVWLINSLREWVRVRVEG